MVDEVKESELELTPEGEALLLEIEQEDVELRPEFVDAAGLRDAFIQEQRFKGIPEVTDEQLEEMDKSFREIERPIDGDEIVEQILIGARKNVTSYFKDKKDDLVSRIIGGIMIALKDIFLIGNYAQIAGEVTRLQPLRIKFRNQMIEADRQVVKWLRDRKTEDELDEVLRRTGYNEEAIKTIKTVSEVIPQAQDVIQFAVREVYLPDIVKKFGLDTGFDKMSPEAFSDVDKTGMTKRTFQKFWQAHWRLPGLQESFEMLHRDKIDVPVLKQIMKAQDIMPGFVDPLIEIAFRPYTRVDVRRMHKYGVLDSEEIVRAYKDIGFDEEKAGKMAEFTVEMNLDALESEQNARDRRLNKERDLTKSDILGAYKNDIITRSDARIALQEMKYDREEIELLIARVDYTKNMEIVDDLLRSYKKAYTNGLMTKNELLTKFGELGVTSRQQEVLIPIWDVDRELKLDRPSKSEVLSFFKSGVITEVEVREELSNMGFQDKYINWYILAQGSKK